MAVFADDVYAVSSDNFADLNELSVYKLLYVKTTSDERAANYLPNDNSSTSFHPSCSSVSNPLVRCCA